MTIVWLISRFEEHFILLLDRLFKHNLKFNLPSRRYIYFTSMLQRLMAVRISLKIPCITRMSLLIGLFHYM